MKKQYTLLMTLVALLAVSISALAQKKKGAAPENPEAGKFKVEQSKLLPKLKRLAITELTVNYKLTTTAKTIVREKGAGKIAGARVTAYLEFTDSEPTPEDFQGITDHFYRYFQKQLKANGIDTVGWNEIVASEFYQKIGDDEKDDDKKEGGGNAWVVSTANKGKIVHNGMVGFAGNKGKRAADFAEQFGTAASFKVNVDFAEVLVNLELKTTARKDLYDGWYYPESTSKKYTWGVHAQMMVGDPENKQASYIWAQKGWPEFVLQWRDIAVAGEYSESMTEDASKARSGLAKQFAFSKELTPVLVQATRAKYIAAAKNAVERWVDAFVARAVSMRN